MRLRELRRAAWAAWLGVLALVLDALVPVHAAFDLADAFAAPSHGAARSLAWHVLALAVGHEEPDGQPGGDHHHHRHHSHHTTCAVCSAAGTLAGFAAAAAFLLPAPHSIGVSTLLASAAEEPRRTPAAAYRSRAPPLG
jgi:hypothetical protein